jgi:hypothetical protein
LRREFCCKPLTSLADWIQKSPQRARICKIPCYFPCYQGIWARRLVRIGLHPQPLGFIGFRRNPCLGRKRNPCETEVAYALPRHWHEGDARQCFFCSDRIRCLGRYGITGGLRETGRSELRAGAHSLCVRHGGRRLPQGHAQISRCHGSLCILLGGSLRQSRESRARRLRTSADSIQQARPWGVRLAAPLTENISPLNRRGAAVTPRCEDYAATAGAFTLGAEPAGADHPARAASRSHFGAFTERPPLPHVSFFLSETEVPKPTWIVSLPM